MLNSTPRTEGYAGDLFSREPRKPYEFTPKLAKTGDDAFCSPNLASKSVDSAPDEFSTNLGKTPESKTGSAEFCFTNLGSKTGSGVCITKMLSKTEAEACSPKLGSKKADKTMTIREMADALGVDVSTISKRVKELFPEVVQKGKTTKLNEAQVTAIKICLNGVHNFGSTSEVTNTNTELEMMLLDQKVSLWKTRRIQELTEQNEQLRGENALLTDDARVARTIAIAEGLKTVSEVAKINGIGPRKFFEMLSERKILYRLRGNWIPFQDYIEMGYFVVKERTYGNETAYLTSQTYVTGKGEVWLAKRMFPTGGEVRA